jgi:hypothetical protein
MLFIQVVHKARSSSQVPESDAHQGEAELQAGDGPATDPQQGDGGSTKEEEGDGDTPFEGAIDEGEVNEEVLRWYEMEADEDERGLEEDSSDDEHDPLVPRDWDSYNFSQLSVNPSENVSWEYRDNMVSVGAMYKNAVKVKDAVKRWATRTLQREFRVVKSSPHIYDVQCLKPNYPFRVYASKGKWKNYWEIKFVVDHTCALDQLDASHCNLSSGFVASQMFAKIVENPSYEPKSIILAIEEKFRYQISYGQYEKTSNRSRSICNGPLTPVTSTHICNGCCLAPVTYKCTRTTRGLASTTPVTNVDFWKRAS